ncbi:MAG: zf-HC2 domain-containing protein [Acidobacteriota bacterium]
MAVNDERTAGDKETWSRYAGLDRKKPGSPCPDANLMAAYVDGSATESEQETVERHLASCDSCLHAVVEVRALGRSEAPAGVPGDVVSRATALVPGPRPTYDRKPVWLFGPISQAAKWAAAAAVMVAACAAGYELGASTCRVKSRIGNAVHAELAAGVSDPQGLDPGVSTVIDTTSGGAK